MRSWSRCPFGWKASPAPPVPLPAFPPLPPFAQCYQKESPFGHFGSRGLLRGPGVRWCVSLGLHTPGATPSVCLRWECQEPAAGLGGKGLFLKAFFMLITDVVSKTRNAPITLPCTSLDRDTGTGATGCLVSDSSFPVSGRGAPESWETMSRLSSRSVKGSLFRGRGLELRVGSLAWSCPAGRGCPSSAVGHHAQRPAPAPLRCGFCVFSLWPSSRCPESG